MVNHDSYWYSIVRRFTRKKLGLFSFYVFIAFCLMAIYAPFLASSKPLLVIYDGTVYFPLFRYLFFEGFFTKSLDIFFNILIFIVPLFGLAYLIKVPKWVYIILTVLPFLIFAYLLKYPLKDPASDPLIEKARLEDRKKLPENETETWAFELKYMNDYERLNLILKDQQNERFHKAMAPYAEAYVQAMTRRLNKPGRYSMPTLWVEQQEQEKKSSEGAYYQERRTWLNAQRNKISLEIMPLITPFHWEDDVGGNELLNQQVPWWQLTRLNRKDLLSALIFGTRISLVVGITATALALVIGIPIGALAGFYGGTTDIVVSRIMEVWEAMPTFFMLLMVVAITHSKTIFLIIAVIGFFGWTGFSRYVRGEFFKQRNLPYVEACRALGFNDAYIMFSHLLPNAIPPILTLLPFAVMGAITTEAGLSFLGLGEEGSSSWGVLMDEGRIAFPGESYLLWPPAIILTVLLIAIALIGDALRDALDPKL